MFSLHERFATALSLQHAVDEFQTPYICIEAAFTQQRFFMNTVTLVFVFTEEMQHLHKVILSAEVNYAR